MSEDGSYYPSRVYIYFDNFFPVRLFFRLRAYNRVCGCNKLYKHPCTHKRSTGWKLALLVRHIEGVHLRVFFAENSHDVWQFSHVLSASQFSKEFPLNFPIQFERMVLARPSSHTQNTLDAIQSRDRSRLDKIFALIAYEYTRSCACTGYWPYESASDSVFFLYLCFWFCFVRSFGVFNRQGWRMNWHGKLSRRKGFFYLCFKWGALRRRSVRILEYKFFDFLREWKKGVYVYAEGNILWIYEFLRDAG